jgi:hypothetical protein
MTNNSSEPLETIIIFASSDRKLLAIATPIPLEAPVIKTFLSLRLDS